MLLLAMYYIATVKVVTCGSVRTKKVIYSLTNYNDNNVKNDNTPLCTHIPPPSHLLHEAKEYSGSRIRKNILH